MAGRNLVPTLAMVIDALHEPLTELRFELGDPDLSWGENSADFYVYHSQGWIDGEPALALNVTLTEIDPATNTSAEYCRCTPF